MKGQKQYSINKLPLFIEKLRRYHPVEPRYDFWLLKNGELSLEPPENYVSHIGLLDCEDQYLSDIDTVVVKFGSNSLVYKKSEAEAYARYCAANDLTRLRKDYGKRVIVVSSGGMAMGRKRRLRAGEKIPKQDTFSKKQLIEDARWGQGIVYDRWRDFFTIPPLRQRIRQSLVTNNDFSDPKQRKRIIHEYNLMMDNGVIPIVNEDDFRQLTTSDRKYIAKSGTVFGCNDGLASYIARNLAQGDDHKVLMILMTSEWGIRPKAYFKDPINYSLAHFEEVIGGERRIAIERQAISVISDMEGIENQVVSFRSSKGRGGMDSKMTAIRDAVNAGIYVVAVDGCYPHYDSSFQKGEEGAARTYFPLEAVLNGEFIGSRIMPKNR